MSKTNKMGITVFPKDRDFSITVGSVSLGSRVYANSSNTYRGAKAALRNFGRRNVTNESNYGDNVVTIVNDNNFVIAASANYSPKTAKANASKLNLVAKEAKKLKLEIA